MTEIICEFCEGVPATHFYRNYLGPHAACEECFQGIVIPRSYGFGSQVKEIDVEEYVEDRVIDEIMEN